MSELPQHETRVRRATEVFDDLRGAGNSTQEIFVEAYDALKQIAHKMLSNQPAGDSMRATRLLSDLYIKLFGRSSEEFNWESGVEFYYAITHAMHQLLVDYVRRARAEKRGGGRVGSLDELNELGVEVGTDRSGALNENWFEKRALQALESDEALRRLRQENPRQSKVLYLTYYGGFTREEVATTMNLGPETVKADLRKARARLKFYQSGLV